MPRNHRSRPAIVATTLGIVALGLIALALVVREDAPHPHAAGGVVMRML